MYNPCNSRQTYDVCRPEVANVGEFSSCQTCAVPMRGVLKLEEGGTVKVKYWLRYAPLMLMQCWIIGMTKEKSSCERRLYHNADYDVVPKPRKLSQCSRFAKRGWSWFGYLWWDDHVELRYQAVKPLSVKLPRPLGWLFRESFRTWSVAGWRDTGGPAGEGGGGSSWAYSSSYSSS